MKVKSNVRDLRRWMNEDGGRFVCVISFEGRLTPAASVVSCFPNVCI